MKVKIIFIIIIFIFGFFSCSDEEEEDKPKDKKVDAKNVPSFVSETFYHVIYNDKGEKEAFIKGERDIMYNSKNELYLKNFKGLILRPDKGKIYEIEISADNAKWSRDSNSIEAWGNVVAIKQGDLRIETERIFWDNGTQTLQTNKEEKVVIYKMDGTITRGKHLVADTLLGNISLDESITQTQNNVDLKKDM